MIILRISPSEVVHGGLSTSPCAVPGKSMTPRLTSGSMEANCDLIP